MKGNNGNKNDAVTQAVNGFERRHIGLSSHNIDYMLDVLGESSMTGFIERVVPDSILDRAPLPLQQPLDEPAALKELSQIAESNHVLTCNVMYSKILGGTRPIRLTNRKLPRDGLKCCSISRLWSPS